MQYLCHCRRPFSTRCKSWSRRNRLWNCWWTKGGFANKSCEMTMAGPSSSLKILSMWYCCYMCDSIYTQIVRSNLSTCKYACVQIPRQKIDGAKAHCMSMGQTHCRTVQASNHKRMTWSKFSLAHYFANSTWEVKTCFTNSKLWITGSSISHSSQEKLLWWPGRVLGCA